LLEAISEDPATPPANAAPGPVIVRGARTAGRTPLAVWFTRPDATDPVDVTLRLFDPVGRVTERVITVAGWVAPPPVDLELVDVIKLVFRGAVLQLRSSAPVDTDPPWEMHFAATPRFSGPFPPLPRPVAASFPLPEIPRTAAGVFGRGAPISVVRTNDAAPYEYTASVRTRPPFDVVVALTSPDGARFEVSASID
jgi:hypothetical protein